MQTTADGPSCDQALARVLFSKYQDITHLLETPSEKEEKEESSLPALLRDADRLRQEMHQWFEDCDPRLLREHTAGHVDGVSYTTRQLIEYGLREVTTAYLEHYRHNDGTVNVERLAYDMELCKDICPLYVMHLIAELLAASNYLFTSAILCVPGHCLKQRLSQNAISQARQLQLLFRVVALTAKSDEEALTEIPSYAQSFVAGMYYTNVVFLRPVGENLVTVCANLMDNRFAFSDLAHATRHPELAVPLSYDWIEWAWTHGARKTAIERLEKALQSRDEPNTVWCSDTDRTLIKSE